MKDLSQQRFGLLTALALAGRTYSGGKSRRQWRCRCDCGGEITLGADQLRTLKNPNCGCIARKQKQQQQQRAKVATAPAADRREDQNERQSLATRLAEAAHYRQQLPPGMRNLPARHVPMRHSQGRSFGAHHGCGHSSAWLAMQAGE